MFILQAPLPALQSTTVLPDPQWSDQARLTDAVVRKLAMDGTRYTYVKRTAQRMKLSWTFHLTRNKGLELRAFIKAYHASRVKAVDHHGQVWAGNFASNPFEFETPERGGPPIAPMPRGELQVIRLEFEGVKA